MPIALLTALLQSTLVASIRLFGVSPDLHILVVVTWVLLRGRREGMLVGLIIGGVLDALSAAPFGTLTASLALVGFMAGFGEINVFRSVRFFPLVVMAIATLAYYGVTSVVIAASGHGLVWGAALWRTILPAIVINTLCMWPIYGLGSWLARRTGPVRAEWEA